MMAARLGAGRKGDQGNGGGSESDLAEHRKTPRFLNASTFEKERRLSGLVAPCNLSG
jgi:hypothetical protein